MLHLIWLPVDAFDIGAFHNFFFLSIWLITQSHTLSYHRSRTQHILVCHLVHRSNWLFCMVSICFSPSFFFCWSRQLFSFTLWQNVSLVELFKMLLLCLCMAISVNNHVRSIAVMVSLFSVRRNLLDANSISYMYICFTINTIIQFRIYHTVFVHTIIHLYKMSTLFAPRQFAPIYGDYWTQTAESQLNSARPAKIAILCFLRSTIALAII